VLGEPDVGVIIDCFGCGEENDPGVRSAEFPGLADEFFADSLALVGEADGEVGEVGAVGEVGEGAGDADEVCGVPCGDDQIGIVQHFGHALTVVGGAAFAESGGVIEVDHLVESDGVAGAVFDHRMGLVALSGVEPEHPFEYQILSLARLPIPPQSHGCTRRGNFYETNMLRSRFQVLPSTKRAGSSVGRASHF
jgi:hypothetical protein